MAPAALALASLLAAAPAPPQADPAARADLDAVRALARASADEPAIAACNQCHKHLTAHGSRRTVGLCLTCHEPGWIQAASANNTANAIDFRVMVHRIHRGQQAGDSTTTPYVYKWSATNDFSEVAFAPPNSVRNCTMCHQGGAMSTNWKTKPGRAACEACHYDVNAATGVNHAGGAITDGDSSCSFCHQADTNGVAPAISLVHSNLYDPETNTTFVGKNLQVTINSVNFSSAAAPKVTFTMTIDGAPASNVAPLVWPDSLRFTIAGPTSDYAGDPNLLVGYTQSAAFGGATGAASALIAAGTAPGQFVATMPDLSAISGMNVGVGVEAYVLETGTCGTAPCATHEWASNAAGVKYARVGSTTAGTARRTLVDNAKCNKCHEDLGFHGGEARKTPEYCAMCHNSRNVNDERTSQYEVVPGTTTPFSKTPNTVRLAIMIHKIHKGGDLANPYALGATRDFRADPTANPPRAEGEAPPAEFNHAFPGDLQDCQTCHVAGGYGLPEATVNPTRFVTFTCKEDPVTGDTGATPPRADNMVCGTLSATGGVVVPDSTAGDAYWTKTETFVGSGASHCGSCHDTATAGAHFTANTIAGVESCDVCHGDGRTWDSNVIHVPNP